MNCLFSVDLMLIDARIHTFLNKTPTNNFPFESFPLVQFLLIVLCISYIYYKWMSSVGCILSGARFRRLARNSGDRIRPFNYEEPSGSKHEFRGTWSEHAIFRKIQNFIQSKRFGGLFPNSIPNNLEH